MFSLSKDFLTLEVHSLFYRGRTRSIRDSAAPSWRSTAHTATPSTTPLPQIFTFPFLHQYLINSSHSFIRLTVAICLLHPSEQIRIWPRIDWETRNWSFLWGTHHCHQFPAAVTSKSGTDTTGTATYSPATYKSYYQKTPYQSLHSLQRFTHPTTNTTGVYLLPTYTGLLVTCSVQQSKRTTVSWSLTVITSFLPWVGSGWPTDTK